MTRLGYSISGRGIFAVERVPPDPDIPDDDATIQLEVDQLTMYLSDAEAIALSRALAGATLEEEQ